VTEKLLAQLRASLPQEALKTDTSRGFALTSTKAAYVLERMSDVFGPLGIGWRYAHSPCTVVTHARDDGEERVEIVVEVVVQYRTEELTGLSIVWDRANGDWNSPVWATSGWSEPIFAYGGNQETGGSMPRSDAMKSAVTAGLTKAMSRLGIALEVHKGNRDGNVRSTPRPQQHSSPARRENSAQAPPPAAWEWESYWEQFSAEQEDEQMLARASVVTVEFGKYKGKTIGTLVVEDPGYIAWLTSGSYDPQGDARKIKVKNAAIYARACAKWNKENYAEDGPIEADDIPFDAEEAEGQGALQL
jgi:hypothetical protein